MAYKRWIPDGRGCIGKGGARMGLAASIKIGFVAGQEGGDVRRGERYRGVRAGVKAVLTMEHPLYCS